ncbi:Maf family protein [Halioglobus pacificus]|uniref:7-methyl-GTP pyrophosphatase n=1 Tax=Parahalioglobus pacificus TaxID=930806 RepID=A0A918XFW3_9GAMM|nr:nucleoside triphosphate pyrophosphatase [Halioglobus pacificus]GHD29830.1 Maf-like protein YceF [Halioglobus pacificus]
MALILASSSKYRQSLLHRLGLPFDAIAPDIDESAQPGESPEALATRLAHIKAYEIAANRADDWVIGSDQVASLNGNILGKPGTEDVAIAQLQASSGNVVHFYTAVTLTNHRKDVHFHHLEPTAVHFRELSKAEICDYVRRDQPLDCAGSFKWESLGIALFERLEGRDPTALEGLPLIALSSMLQAAGLSVLRA